MQKQPKQQKKQEQTEQERKQRWCKSLRFGMVGSYDDRRFQFPNINQTVITLRQIFKLSLTPEGCQLIHKTLPNLINNYLMQGLQIKWRPSSHHDFDHLSLKIIPNLMKSPFYYQWAFYIKNRFKSLTDRPRFPSIFGKKCKQVYESIEIASKKYEESIQAERYNTKFQSQQQALKQLRRIRNKNDILNFSINCTKFQQQFPQYVKVLEQCIKYDLKSQILDVFPKDCIGCMIFSMIVCSNRIKRPQIAINFLNLMSNGWFNQELYKSILSKIKSLYRHLEYNQDLQDKGQLVCLRFTQYDRTIYQWMSSQKMIEIFNAKYGEECPYSEIKSEKQFQEVFTNSLKNKIKFN